MKKRLDLILVEREFFETREKAKREIMAGNVIVNEQVVIKAGTMFKDNDELNVDLSFGSLNDFSPDSIANKVPELKKLLELREALTAVKGPLGNVPAFRARLTELLENDESREKLLEELNLVSPKK